jgi:glycosyltransferase involved in cell wall biosynthesis
MPKEKMKILNYLNISNPSNLRSDSGFIFQELLMKKILELRPNWEFYFICSKKTPKIRDRRIRNITLNNNKDAYSSRFSFNWEEFKKKLKKIKLDAALINQSELSSNFFIFFNNVFNKEIPIVSYYHYLNLSVKNSKRPIFYDLNCGECGKIIFMKQIEAASISRMNLICSNFGKSLLLKNARKITAFDLSPFLNINPPISLEEVDKVKVNNKKPNELKTLIYNHRLYRHYGTGLILKWLEELYEKRKDFRVIFTDPTHKRSKIRNSYNPEVEHYKKIIKKSSFGKLKYFFSRHEYYKEIKDSYGGIAHLNKSTLWSMSMIDIMACSKPVIAPNIAAFPEILTRKNRDLLFKNKYEFFEKINKILDNEKYRYTKGEQCREIAENYDIGIVARS